MTYVYRHRRLDNNKVFYIGIGSKKRAFSKLGHNILWNRVVDKTEYDVEILCCLNSRTDACDLEVFLIQEYGRISSGGTLVNMTAGGDKHGVGEDHFLYGVTGENHPAHGYRHTPEAIEKIRVSSMGRKYKPRTKEYREKVRNQMLGTKWSDKMYKVFCIPVLQYNKLGEFISEYKSSEEAERLTGILANNIGQCRLGKRKSAGGYIWKSKKE